MQQEELRVRVNGLRFEKGTGFASEGSGISGVGADLDEQDLAGGVDGVEIDFIALRGAEVVEFVAAALEFDENGGLQGVPKVGATYPFIDRDEAGIDCGD